MKETLKEHKDVWLLEILKEKEQVESRIGDFNIDCIIDEETQVNIMPEITWIERDQARKKEEEEVLEQQRQELKYFMIKRIEHLIEE